MNHPHYRDTQSEVTARRIGWSIKRFTLIVAATAGVLLVLAVRAALRGDTPWALTHTGIALTLTAQVVWIRNRLRRYGYTRGGHSGT